MALWRRLKLGNLTVWQRHLIKSLAGCAKLRICLPLLCGLLPRTLFWLVLLLGVALGFLTCTKTAVAGPSTGKHWAAQSSERSVLCLSSPLRGQSL